MTDGQQKNKYLLLKKRLSGNYKITRMDEQYNNQVSMIKFYKNNTKNMDEQYHNQVSMIKFYKHNTKTQVHTYTHSLSRLAHTKQCGITIGQTSELS